MASSGEEVREGEEVTVTSQGSMVTNYSISVPLLISEKENLVRKKENLVLNRKEGADGHGHDDMGGVL